MYEHEYALIDFLRFRTLAKGWQISVMTFWISLSQNHCLKYDGTDLNFISWLLVPCVIYVETYCFACNIHFLHYLSYFADTFDEQETISQTSNTWDILHQCRRRLSIFGFDTLILDMRWSHVSSSIVTLSVCKWN